MPTTPPARNSISTTIPPPFSAATPHTAMPACSRGGVIPATRLGHGAGRMPAGQMLPEAFGKRTGKYTE